MMELSFLVVILILLITSRLAGELLERAGQPAMVGEVLVGIILGPSVLMVISPEMEWLEVLVNLGLFFLVFLAGIEMSFANIRQHHKPAISIAITSFTFSFSCGVMLGYIFKYDLMTSVIIGLVFSLSALPVAIRIFLDMGQLESRVGRLTIISAVIDDILAMIFLSLVISLAKYDGSETTASVIDIIITICIVFVFITIIYLTDRLLAVRFGLPSMYIKHYIRKLRSREAQFAVILIFGLIIGVIGEFIGITFIIGAFYAGLLIDKKTIGEDVYNKTHNVLSHITSGFMAPIFFAYIGLLFNLRSIFNYSQPFSHANMLALFFLVCAVLFATLGKALGSYLGARAAGIQHKESLAIGFGLNARGLMGLVIALVAYQKNLIDEQVFSILVAMSFITTLIAPIVLRNYFRKANSEPPAKKSIKT